MKYCIIIPDGSADFPLQALGGKTPLQVAETPNMDIAAREGLLGLVRTVPPLMDPGSDVAIMSVMGYNPLTFHTGRAPLEAADIGLELKHGQWAFRCNFISTENRLLKDFSAGHISTAEASKLIATLNTGFSDLGCRFYTGTGYRHLMIYEDTGHLDLETNAPHQVMGRSLFDIQPSGAGSKKLIEIMEKSRGLMRDHPVNAARREKKLPTADMIWLWGEGTQPVLEPFRDRFGLSGAAISAVNLVRGMAKLIGWEIIDVPNITGYLDTDYAAKGRYAVEALAKYDLLLVHIEAPDEASHEGNARAKVEAIEEVDRKITAPVMEYGRRSGNLRLLILPDHYTSIKTRRHTRGDVPFAMWGCGISAASGLPFTEANAMESDIVLEKGYDLMSTFLRK